MTRRGRLNAEIVGRRLAKARYRIGSARRIGNFRISLKRGIGSVLHNVTFGAVDSSDLEGNRRQIVRGDRNEREIEFVRAKRRGRRDFQQIGLAFVASFVIVDLEIIRSFRQILKRFVLDARHGGRIQNPVSVGVIEPEIEIEAGRVIVGNPDIIVGGPVGAGGKFNPVYVFGVVQTQRGDGEELRQGPQIVSFAPDVVGLEFVLVDNNGGSRVPSGIVPAGSGRLNAEIIGLVLNKTGKGIRSGRRIFLLRIRFEGLVGSILENVLRRVGDRADRDLDGRRVGKDRKGRTRKRRRIRSADFKRISSGIGAVVVNIDVIVARRKPL